MAKYVDLVLAKTERMERPHLFQCPSWSYLSNGDQVMVETKYGKAEMTVVAAFTADEESDYFRFIARAANATLPLKRVLGKVQYKEFYYDEKTTESEVGENGNV